MKDRNVVMLTKLPLFLDTLEVYFEGNILLYPVLFLYNLWASRPLNSTADECTLVRQHRLQINGHLEKLTWILV